MVASPFAFWSAVMVNIDHVDMNNLVLVWQNRFCDAKPLGIFLDKLYFVLERNQYTSLLGICNKTNQADDM